MRKSRELTNIIKNKTAISPQKTMFLGAFLFLIPLFSACDSVPSSIQQLSSQHSSSYSVLPQGKSTNITEDFMQVKLRGSLKIKSIKVNSIDVTELSDLAWDEDEQLLYAISDEGLLYHLQISLKDNKLKSTKVIFATRLKGKSGKKLVGKYSDSEGLSILNSNNGVKGDSKLIISFEHKPRIAYYSPKGTFIKKVKIPKELSKKKYYRSKNKALESVTHHPKYGIITAAEYPLKKYKKNQQSLYSSSGKVWHFPASQATNSAITGLEVLPNGDILLLERAYQNPITPIKIYLRRIKLKECNKSHECQTEAIATFDGADGWLLDNFEGLTHYQDNKYLVVSDDNNNPLQKTILVLFEIKTAQ